MKTNILLSLLLFAFIQSHAQQNDSLIRQTKNAFYIEIGGNSPFISANYERKVFGNNSCSIHSRFGVGFYGHDFKQGFLFIPSIPIEISSSFGSSKHHVEIGVGATPFLSKVTLFRVVYNYDENLDSLDYTLYCLLIARIGYRLETEKGWIYRIGFTPIIYNSSYKSAFDFQYGFGFSVGKFF